MSIFGSIVSKIFGHANAATPAPGTTPSAPTAAPAPSSFNNPTPATPASPGQTATAAPAPSGTAAPGAKTVDASAVLAELAAKNPQKLDWQHSIVDMMKLLGLDSSLTARQELAKELNYTGSTDDSASMNVWLHKQVMEKLAENGGKVPDSLK